MGSQEYGKKQTAWVRSDADSQRLVELEAMRHLASCWSGTGGGKASEAEDAIRALRADAFSFGPLGAQHRLALDLLDNGKVPEFGALSFACRRNESLLKACGGWEQLTDAWLIAPIAHEHLGEERAATVHVLAKYVEWLNAEAVVRAKAMAYAQASSAVMRGEDASIYVDAIDAAEVDPDDDGKTFGVLIADTMLEVLASADPRSRHAITTGFPSLDANMGGLAPGSLTVIGGRPGDGKSSVGLAMLKHWAVSGTRSCMISCEDPQRIVGTRVTAGITLRPQRDYHGTIGGAPHDSMAAADRAQRNSDWERARVVFRIGAKVERVLRAMTRAVRNAGAEVLVVDYLQSIRGDEKLQRNHEVRRIAASIKAHGARLGVPVVLCSQLKRREGKRPTMADLRDAGEIEEMAENIVLLWREPNQSRWAELAKAKSGPPGTTYAVEWHDAAACVLGLVPGAPAEPAAGGGRPRNGFGDE
jgi:replicative DNA helicase